MWHDWRLMQQEWAVREASTGGGSQLSVSNATSGQVGSMTSGSGAPQLGGRAGTADKRGGRGGHQHAQREEVICDLVLDDRQSRTDER